MLWWLPAAVVTLGAMVWVSWLGRTRSEEPDRSEGAQARFAAAIERDLPQGVRRTPSRPHEPSTGIAVRPSQRAHLRRDAGPDAGSDAGSDAAPGTPERRSA